MNWQQQLVNILNDVRQLDEVTFRDCGGDLVVVGRRGGDCFVARIYVLPLGVGVEILDPLEVVEEAVA